MGGGATPVPVSVTACGLPFALSVIETLLVKSLSISGANVTLMVHDALAGRLGSTRIGLGERERCSNANNVKLCRAGVAQRDDLPGADSADRLVAERNSGD